MKDKEARAEIRQVKEDAYRDIQGLRRRIEDLEHDVKMPIPSAFGGRVGLKFVVTGILQHLGLKLIHVSEKVMLEPIEGASDESQSDALDA
jgi:hypothetical protein